MKLTTITRPVKKRKKWKEVGLYKEKGQSKDIHGMDFPYLRLYTFDYTLDKMGVFVERYSEILYVDALGFGKRASSLKELKELMGKVGVA